MHRATPRMTLGRSYNSGGASVTIESADDGKQMQEMGIGMMKGEHRKKVERAQNYGFSCVPHEPDKDEQGNIKDCAQGFCQFIGGSRSYPVVASIDDRRHRLKNQKPGDVALYRGREDRQQFDLIAAGNFLSAGPGKVNRIALVPAAKKKQPSQQQQAGPGGGGGSGQGQQEEEKGQEPAFEDNQKSETFFEQSGDASTMQHGKDIAVKVSKDRAYIRFGGFAFWIDKDGLHTTSPITLAPLPRDA